MVRSVCLVLLLGFASPIFGDDAQPANVKSILLVARKDLPDPFFRDSVVLVTRPGGGAPIGVIINKATELPLARVFSDIERLQSREEKVFFGGPVMPEQLVFVFRAAVAPDEAVEVLEGVYMSPNRKVLRELLGRENPLEGLRVFAGFAGWAPGQLESEIARGDWHLAAADARTVLEKKPERLWEELERRASGVVALR